MLGLGPVIDRRNEQAQAVMGLGAHLEELRKRVLWAVIGLAPIFFVSVFFGRELLNISLEPVRAALHAAGEPDAMQTTSVFEVFYNSVKIAFILTVALGGPWALYQLWLFAAPGLYNHEKRFAYLLAPLSAVLSIGAVLFLYFVILPTMLGFLVQFNAGTFIRANPTAPLPPGVVLPTIPVLTADPPSPPAGSEWINTTFMERRTSLGPDAKGVTVVVGAPVSRSGGLLQQFRVGETLDTFLMFALGCVLAFQTPVVVLLLGWAGIVRVSTLAKFRRHAAAVCAIAGAVLTPSPDPASMLLLAVPMYLLYELGGILLWLLPARRMAGKRPSDDPGDRARDGARDSEAAGGPADGDGA
jgi:sec-independent protein translocase protein TatC